MNIYLYVKTHRITGLKYFGKTTQTDPHKYTGSGKMWKEHLKEFGYNYDTEIIFESTSKEEVRAQGIYYSKLWDIVNSDDWANKKVESGDGGWTPQPGREPWNKGIPMSEAQKEKISNTKKGKCSGIKNPFYGKAHSEETKLLLREANLGRKFSKEVVKARNKKQKGIPKPTVSQKLKGRKLSEETKQKMREAYQKRRKQEQAKLK